MEQEAKEVVLTYETLYELLRKEKVNDELQPLEDKFFGDVLNYLRDKQQSYDENLAKDDIFSQSERDKLHIQLNNIRKILKDLYDIRERKIINMAINKSRTHSNIIDTHNLLTQEKEIFESLHTVLTKYRSSILYKLLDLRKPDPVVKEPIQEPTPEVQDSNVKKIKFIENVEQFVGTELEEYGPFEANQEAELPNELADVLISQGKAIEQ